MKIWKTLIPLLFLLTSFCPPTIPNDKLNSFYSSTIPNNLASCLEHKYKGTWRNNTIYITISYAKYNNLLSLSGKLSGFTQFKNNTCPINGKFKLTGGVYTVDFYENSEEGYCNGSFSGTITCYSDGTVFEGEITTYGKSTPKQEYLKLTSVD